MLCLRLSLLRVRSSEVHGSRHGYKKKGRYDTIRYDITPSIIMYTIHFESIRFFFFREMCPGSLLRGVPCVVFYRRQIFCSIGSRSFPIPPFFLAIAHAYNIQGEDISQLLTGLTSNSRKKDIPNEVACNASPSARDY